MEAEPPEDVGRECDVPGPGQSVAGFTARGYMTGHAELQRFYYGSEAGRWDCEDPGGNGDIVAGQSSCHTGMSYANSSAVTFYAWGYAYDRASYYADGQTARTR
jgi:hypothetical protein